MKQVSKEVPLSGRIYFFDWLRVIACAIVVLIHCVQMFGELYKTRGAVGIEVAGDGIAFFFLSIIQWCMALFFLLAGASTWLALRRKTPRQFIQERFGRLLIPLIIGFILLVPLQAYFEAASNGQYSGTLLEFYPFFLGNILLEGKLQWIISNIHHLWFLAYLFGFSLLALPLCLYLRSAAGLAWIARLTTLCQRPAGLLVLALPIIIVQASLRAAFPVYCSLADALAWILFYVIGYVLFVNPQLRQAIQRQTRMALGLGIAGLSAMQIAWASGLLHAWMYAPDYSIGYLLFQVLGSLTLWSWLIVTLAVGDKYLNKNHAFLPYGSSASFSWYLLHFPIVIIIAYFVLTLHLNILLAFTLISLCALAITLIATDLLLLQRRGTLSMLTLFKARLYAAELPQISVQEHQFATGPLPFEHAITGHLS